MPVIKRYSNRKLYDTEAKRYITLEGLADLIRQGAEVHITDHATGRDITALILAQTVFDLEKRVKGGLPGAVLTNLIRAGSDTINQLREAFTVEDQRDRIDAEIERRIQLLVERGELEQEPALHLLDLLIRTGEQEPAPDWFSDQAVLHVLKQRGLPSRKDVKRMSRKVEELSAELDRIAAERATRRQAKAKPRRPSRASRSSPK